MKHAVAPISLAGAQLGDIRHVCAFFDSREEEYRVLLPFIKDGFECGDRAIHVVDRARRDDHLRRLVACGIDTMAAERGGQLEVRASADTYLENGRFDQDRMLASFERIASGNAGNDFPLSRIVCHMEWVADQGTPADDLVEFESRVNDLWCDHDDAVICTYDLAKFGGDLMMEMVRTHPLLIIGGILHQNPFYVPPARFLREFRQRRGERAA